MKIDKILFNERQIKKRVQELASQISQDYKNSKNRILLIGVLKGAFIFLADLIRYLEISVALDFVQVESYSKGTISKEIKFKKGLDMDIENRDVLIIEDIVDTGQTMELMKNNLSKKNPNSLKICSFLDKSSRRETKVEIDYCGFEVSNIFVVGYGLDYAGDYRGLPYIAALK